MSWNRAALVALAVFAAAALLPGCGGDDDPAPVLPAACLDFVPDSAPAAGDVVARKGAASTCDTLVVEVVVSGFNDVYGGGAVVTHTGSLVRYDGMDTGSTFLDDDGASLLVQDQAAANPATTALTRQGVASGVTVAGGETKVLYGLTFTRISAGGNGRLTFSNASLLDSTGDPMGPQPIPGSLTWAGGDLIVN